MPSIKPDFIITTGDLVDAKDKNKLRSLQYIQEWKGYWNLLDEFHLLGNDYWHGF